MYVKQCQCGAVTVDGDNFSNSMTFETFKCEFPGVRLSTRERYYNCNHCVNNWGIDLCGCGSGEPVGECEEGYFECQNKIPAQVKGEMKRSGLWAS
jgi:hypothetical protein